MRPETRRRVVALGLTTAVVLTGCSGASKVAGEGRLDPDGRVLYTEQDGEPVTQDRARMVRAGDSVEVVDGRARLTLPGGEVLELQPRSVVFFNQGAELRKGDLLVTSASSASQVRAAGNRVTVAGAARITLAPALRVVTYQGTSSVHSGGRDLEVPALRSADVSLIGLLPGRPSPIVLDRNDPWVNRFLGDALDKEAGLESRARGFTSQVSAKDARSPAFYRDLLPGLTQAGFEQADVERFGRPDGGVQAGEVLLGAAVALQGRRGTFAERLAGATAFRAEGASWAVVGVDQQVASIDGLLRLIDGALNVAPLELAAPPPVPVARTVEPAPARTATTRPAARSATTTTTRPAPRTTPSTLPLPAGQQQAPPTTRPPIVLPVEPLLDATLDPVINLLSGLLGNR